MNKQTTALIIGIKKALAENPEWEAEEVYDFFTHSKFTNTEMNETTFKYIFKISKDEFLELCFKTYREVKK